MLIGKIKRLRMSGNLLGILVEDEKTGERRWVHGDWRPTSQALEALFGGLPLQLLVDQRVGYELTDYGALESLREPDDDEAAKDPEG